MFIRIADDLTFGVVVLISRSDDAGKIQNTYNSCISERLHLSGQDYVP